MNSSAENQSDRIPNGVPKMITFANNELDSRQGKSNCFKKNSASDSHSLSHVSSNNLSIASQDRLTRSPLGRLMGRMGI